MVAAALRAPEANQSSRVNEESSLTMLKVVTFSKEIYQAVLISWTYAGLRVSIKHTSPALYLSTRIL